MTIDLLHCFVAVCQEQSITRAAEKLYISKQAVSSNIKSLETELGVDLLIRDHSGIRLTHAGHRLFMHARAILRQWELCLSDLSALQSNRNALRVGMAFMARMLWTSEVSRSFSRHNPDIPIEVLGGYAADLLRALKDDHLDCVVTFLRSEYKSVYNHIPLRDAPLSFLMSESDPLATKALILPDDLNNRTVLFHKSGASYLDELAMWLSQRGIQIHQQIIDHSVLSIEQKAINDDHALSLHNAIYYAAEPQTIGLCTRLVDMEAFNGAPPLTICVLFPKDSSPSLDLLTFAAFFRSHLQLR